MNYTVDPERKHAPGTGIYVRAWDESEQAWVSADMDSLDTDSLAAWLGTLDKAGLIRTIMFLLGHPAA
ncbi:hypothetical protein [Actinomyces urogenitalis]|uniref:hypothetical protein n=1 Tax=Actinomyces urogenitalis TaxID=103621 RepID=UPI00242FC892|nr:hypothetical protein [Actinomyces urogenitalis]MCI7457611.1 hypothetical protein [Actinomyces urogenitalis]